MEKGKIIDVTGQKTFHQDFGQRVIDDSEYANKTKWGYPIKVDSVKVVDITNLFDLNPYLQKLQERLKKENKKRSKESAGTRKWLSEKISKISKGKFRVHIAYFHLQYKNKAFGRGPVKWIFNDHYCSVYIDNDLRAGNMEAYWHMMKPLKSNENGFRETVKKRMDRAYERDELGIELNQLVDLMIKCAPRKKREPQLVS